MIGDIYSELGEQAEVTSFHVRTLQPTGRLVAHSTTYDKQHRSFSLESYVEYVKSRHPDAKIVKAYERRTRVIREIHYRMY